VGEGLDLIDVLQCLSLKAKSDILTQDNADACLVYPSVQNVEKACSSETSMNLYHTAPEVGVLQQSL
jgi:hypothetical protein